MSEININGPFRGGADSGVPVITVASGINAVGATTRYTTSINGNKTIRVEQTVAGKNATFDIYGGFSDTDVGVKLNTSSITVSATTPYMGTTPDALPRIWVVFTAMDAGASCNFKVAG